MIDTPFKRARIELTVNYMIIFTVILVIFTLLTFQAKESAFVRVHTVVDTYSQGGPQAVELSQKLDEFNTRFQQRLIVFDIFLWLIAARLSYYLAGKTLQPIKSILTEQKTFVADMSHGLRTPLSTMNLEIEAFLRTQKKLDPLVNQLLDSIKEELSYLKRITEGVLSLNRIKKNEFERDWINLNVLINGVVKRMDAAAKAKKQQLNLINQAKIFANVNEDQIKQVITILLDNAIKYSPEKGKITVTTQKHQSFLKILISDNGPGIEKAELPFIFNRFTRGTRTNHLARGAGLGLSIAKKIIEAHEGTLSLKSQINKGTTFIISLPNEK